MEKKGHQEIRTNKNNMWERKEGKDKTVECKTQEWKRRNDAAKRGNKKEVNKNKRGKGSTGRKI